MQSLALPALMAAAMVLGTLFSSCHRQGYPPMLVTIDSLCETRPDSAMSLLQSLDSSMFAPGSDAHWRYRTLKIKAKLKTYAVLDKADYAEAERLLNHYEDHGTPDELSYAYYCMARACQDAKDAPMAIDYFRKAIATLKDTTNLQLRSAYNFRVGYLLFDQDLNDDAIRYFKESLRLERMRKDTAMMGYCLEKIAYSYRNKRQIDSSQIYFDKARALAREKNDTLLEMFFTASKSYSYIELDDYAEAEKCVRPYIPYVDNGERDAFYYVMAKSCFENGKLEESRKYCELLMEEGTIAYKQMAMGVLVDYYAAKGDVPNIKKSVKLFRHLTYAQQETLGQEAVARVEASYNYNAYKDKNAKLMVDNARKATFISMLIGVLAVVMMVLTGILLWVRHQAKERKRRFEAFQKEVKSMSDAQIEANVKEINRLQAELARIGKASTGSVIQLTQQKEALEMANAIASQKKTFSDATKRRIVESPIYNNVRQKAVSGKLLSDREWSDIEAFVQDLLPGFKSALLSLANISEQDYHLCLLIRLGGLKGREMAVLMGRTESAITKAKRRLQAKLIGQSSDKDSLEKLFYSL